MLTVFGVTVVLYYPFESLGFGHAQKFQVVYSYNKSSF